MLKVLKDTGNNASTDHIFLNVKAGTVVEMDQRIYGLLSGTSLNVALNEGGVPFFMYTGEDGRIDIEFGEPDSMHDDIVMYEEISDETDGRFWENERIMATRVGDLADARNMQRFRMLILQLKKTYLWKEVGNFLYCYEGIADFQGERKLYVGIDFVDSIMEKGIGRTDFNGKDEEVYQPSERMRQHDALMRRKYGSLGKLGWNMEFNLGDSRKRTKPLVEISVLDKNVGMPLYNYLKKGNDLQNSGRIRDGKHLLNLFFRFVTDDKDGATEEEWNTFSRFCRSNGKLSKHFDCHDVFGYRAISVFDGKGKELEGRERLNYINSNAGAIYRIFAFTQPCERIWERFYLEYGLNRHNIEGVLPSNLIFNNPETTGMEWMLHFCKDEASAKDIERNGFRGGLRNEDLDAMAYSSGIPKDRKDGKIFYAYSVEDISSNAFKDKYSPIGERAYDNTFDEKAWEYAVGDAVVFKANGVKAWHKGDEDYQVMFNGDTARDFVRLHRIVLHGKPNPIDTKRMGRTFVWCVMSKANKVLYYNYSITKAVAWIARNF